MKSIPLKTGGTVKVYHTGKGGTFEIAIMETAKRPLSVRQGTTWGTEAEAMAALPEVARIHDMLVQGNRDQAAANERERREAKMERERIWGEEAAADEARYRAEQARVLATPRQVDTLWRMIGEHNRRVEDDPGQSIILTGLPTSVSDVQKLTKKKASNIISSLIQARRQS